MNETVTAFLKVSHNLVRTGMYSFLFGRLGIMSRGPDRTFQGAVSDPRAVVCPSLIYLVLILQLFSSLYICSFKSIG